MPITQDLPNELLLEILSYLDYFDVRNCLQATKKLRAIAYNSALDHKLFRSKVVKRKDDITDMDTFVIHPVFSCTMYTNKMLLPEGPCILTSYCANNMFYTGISVLRTSVHKENFASPPISYIQYGASIIENKDKSAITVGQVFKEGIGHNIEMQNDWDETLSYDLCIDCVKWRLAQCEGTEKHVEIRCKDIVAVSRITLSTLSYLQIRSNGTAFLEVPADPWKIW